MGSTQFPQYNMAKLFTEVNKIYDNLLLAKYIKLSYPQKKKIVYMHLYSISVPATWAYSSVVYKLDINLSGTGYEYTYAEDEDYPTLLEAYKNYNLQYSVTNNSTNPDDDPESLEIITAEVFADTFRKLFRNIGMEPAESDIPSEYTQITAIRPTSLNTGAIINTGIAPDVDDMKMELYIQTYGNTNWRIFRSNDGTHTYGITGAYGSPSTGGGYVCFCGGDGSTSSNYCVSDIKRPSGTYTLLKVIGTWKDGVVTMETHKVNGNVIDQKTANCPFVAFSEPICVFGDTQGLMPETTSNWVYRARIWKSGNLVMDYVPVTRNSDSKPGFWDTVSKTFKTNDYLTAYGG